MRRGISRARRIAWGLGLTPALLLVSSCFGMGHGTAAATWQLDPGAQVDADTTTFGVLVTRLGCNGGVTGEVVDPDIDYRSDAVVLTFVVTPGEPRGGATCPGNDQVAFEVTLDEPLGDRQLVDGQCLVAGAARSTAECDEDAGARYTPGED